MLVKLREQRRRASCFVQRLLLRFTRFGVEDFDSTPRDSN